MQTRHAVGLNEFKRMTTSEMRGAFLLDHLFSKGNVELVYWETDRAVIGSAVPLETVLTLETAGELASEFFLERRELGVFNIGGAGVVRADGKAFAMEALDCLYIGRGTREVSFESRDANAPAQFYLISYPAHAVYPTVLIANREANRIALGSQETANARTIFQYIHEGGAKSCQLVMGFTRLETGSVWNTMPPHTHARRSEVYLYLGIPDGNAVFHFMGPGDETRHLVVHENQAVLSPIWSIHSGCGSSAYGFLWAMGGENQRFADMDAVSLANMR